MRNHNGMRPQDVVLLLRVLSWKAVNPWRQLDLAHDLGMSQSEVASALERCRIAGLIDQSKRHVFTGGLFEFLVHGLRYVYPVVPGAVMSGIPTAHSAAPLNGKIISGAGSESHYVWPSAEGTRRGIAITPLYPAAVGLALKFPVMHEFLALLDALRVGTPRMRNEAERELKLRIESLR